MSWSNGAGQLTEQEAGALLLAALRQPLEEPGETHIGAWFEVLERSLPLWSFQTQAYRELHAHWASTYPLTQIIDSILQDEGGPPPDSRLSGSLHERRRQITEDVSVVKTWGLTNVLGQSERFPSEDALYWEPDLREIAASFNLNLEDIGLEMVSLADAVREARGTTDRAEARKNLDEYFAALIETRRGRPTKGPPTPILKALYDEGKLLFRLLWGVGDFDVDARSAQALKSVLPISEDVEELTFWSYRLVLPILSQAELLTVFSEAETSHKRHRMSGKPTPRYLTIWALAHRLRLNPVTLAEKVLGSRDAEHFPYKDNPIDDFLTH